MEKKRFLYSVAVGAMMAAIILGYGVVWPKLKDLRFRLQLIEARQQSFGAVLAADSIAYQAERGDANIRIEDESPFRDGSWQLLRNWKKFNKTKALGVYRDRLCAGLSGSHAEVWCFDGIAWKKIGFWPELRDPTAILQYGEQLVIAIDRQVLSYDERSWRNLSAPTGKDHAYSLASQGGNLFVGLIGSSPRVLKFSETDGWLEVSGGLPKNEFKGIYELWTHTDGRLYAGLISQQGSTMVYRLEGANWVPVGGNGIRGSWKSPARTYAFSFSSLQNQLIVTMNRHPMAHGQFSPVWAFNGEDWHPVAATSVPDRFSQMDNFNSSIAYRGRLYTGAGGAPPGNASVWELSEYGWREVGGHGVGKSWGPEKISNSRDATREYVYRLIEWRHALVAGFGDAPGAAQIWIYKPQSKH